MVLRAVHERVYGLDSEWAQHLERSYFPAAILRDYHRRGEPLWYLDLGSRSARGQEILDQPERYRNGMARVSGSLSGLPSPAACDR